MTGVPLLSVVVLGFRNFDVTTRACLDSLKPWLPDPEIELLVVDNGSDDDSPQKTRVWCDAHPGVHCLISDVNRGFAGGMNWGAERARGRWLVLVNNDTLFPEHTLDALKRVVNEVSPEVAMLGPVTNAAGNGQRLWKPGAGFEEWLQIGAWLNRHPTHELMPAYRCDFFCIAIRRDAWDQLGGLDTAFGLGYYEDFDFSLRVSKAGYRQMITEDVFVLHVGSATFRHDKTARNLIKQNKKLLLSKHSDAKFEHTRLGNLMVMLEYQRLKAANCWSENLEMRWQLRHGALEGDAPRSLLKKWLWKRKITPLL